MNGIIRLAPKSMFWFIEEGQGENGSIGVMGILVWKRQVREPWWSEAGHVIAQEAV